MAGGNGMSAVRERMRIPYGQRGARYGDGGTAAGVSGLTGMSPATSYGASGGAQYGGMGTATAQQFSGLGRFGSAGGFTPKPYTPGNYQSGGGAQPFSLNLRPQQAPGATGQAAGGLASYGQGGGDGGGLGGSTPSSGGFGFSATPGQIGRGIGVAGAVLGMPGMGLLSNATGISRGISDYGAANNNANYGHEGMNYGAGGYGGVGGYGGSDGIGSGPGGADGNAGDAGSSDAGSTGAGGDTGSDGSGGDGTGSGGDTGGDGSGWARGGWVTRDRLRGRNPRGPDDGYGALDIDEFVLPRSVALPLARSGVLPAQGGK